MHVLFTFQMVYGSILAKLSNQSYWEIWEIRV
jgi:hypothetical protein